MDNSKFYFERQYNWLILSIVLLLFGSVIVSAAIQEDVNSKEVLIAIATVGVIFILVALMTYKIEITADECGVSVVMGIGLAKKLFLYPHIKSVSVVKLRGKNLTKVGVSPFTALSFFHIGYSWKVRSRTMMYNNGLNRKGICIYEEGGRISYYLIGTRKPEVLSEFIQNRISKEAR